MVTDTKGKPCIWCDVNEKNSPHNFLRILRKFRNT